MKRRRRWDKPDPELEAALRSGLLEPGWLEPVGKDTESNRRWHAFDLISMIEGCFGEVLSPDTLDRDSWALWVGRTGNRFMFPSYELAGCARKDPYESKGRYWLIHDGQRVGTIKLDLLLGSGVWLPVHGLYVGPQARRCGVASRVLQAAAVAAEHAGLAGIKLGTNWTWQKSLRFYLNRGFWVWSWTYDICLIFAPRWPRWKLSIEGDEASFAVSEGQNFHVILRAMRNGSSLHFETLPDKLPKDIQYAARSTLSVLLALNHFPLVRSERTWAQRHRWTNGGEPEGLAQTIGRFEGTARSEGWQIPTPMIPGLERWLAWSEGEGYGKKQEAIEAVITVLHARRIRTASNLTDVLRAVPYWNFERLLAKAATASSLEDWEQALDRAKAFEDQPA